MSQISNMHTSPSVTHQPPHAPLSEKAASAPGAGVCASSVNLTAEQSAEAKAKIHTALNDGWDPASQLDEPRLRTSAMDALGTASSKIQKGLGSSSILQLQILFIQLMQATRKGERESAMASRQMGAETAKKSFEAQMEAAGQEYKAALKKGIGQIVQGVGQAGVAASTPNVATAQGVGAALGGITELVSAGDQQDASQARALAALMDKNREVQMGDAQRAQENAANAAQAVSELTRATGEMLTANAELAKVVARG